jgi:phospholipase C
MHCRSPATLRRRLSHGASVSMFAAAGTSAHAADADKAVDAIKTASPIKHVIIIVGENRSFDHLFATYAPRIKDEKVSNLLSESIVNAGGSASRNLARLINSRSWLPPNGGKYLIGIDKSQRALYNMLPLPEVDGVQTPPRPASSVVRAARPA